VCALSRTGNKAGGILKVQPRLCFEWLTAIRKLCFTHFTHNRKMEDSS
jgi:hypothetical protein